MPADPARVKSLFLQAAELPAADRPAFAAAVADPEERAELERLLLAHDAPDPRLDATPAHAPGEPTAAHSSGDVGQLVAGRYKLVERIGEGGMGTVWMAQQTEPVKRMVAVKLIKAGMDSKAVLARFDAERQALAMMDHPNIAKVLDGGLHEGRPYFVMELVKGTPITEFCDARRLTPRQRLELFVPVCQAIQHAHQKGVIHRDIKPSNVLVALYDDRPVPKVIDFGIAKATGATLTDHSLVTGYGAVVGTPEYMSPEQASFNQLDVDTRSDVYSLGVLLYELLTGSTPVDRKSLGKAALLEVLRVVREVEAPRPSDKLSTSAALPSVAANRGTDPARLSRLMRGELDWLVLKALEKDRARRYDTANGLARDIQRYLADEVVEARPPTAGYRARKFVRRHKGQVVAAVLVFLALLAGIAGTTAGLVWATRAAEAERVAREDSEDQKQKAERSKEKAEEKEEEARAVIKFFEDQVFTTARPKGQRGGLGKDVTLRDAIASSLPVLEHAFADQPLVEARLRNTLGTTFSCLGDGRSATEQFARARLLYATQHGPEHLGTLRSMNNLASTYLDSGRHEDSRGLLEEVLAAYRRLLPADHPETLPVMHNLARSYHALGRAEDARKLGEAVVAARKRVLPTDHPDTLTSMANLATCYHALRRHADAFRLREETLAACRRAFPPDHPDTLPHIANLANSYASLGRHADALRLREEALATCRRVLPSDHPGTIMSMTNLSNSYISLGRHKDALVLREEVLTTSQQALGADHPETLASYFNLANSYADLGRHAEALKMGEEALTGRRRVLGADHPETFESQWGVSHSLIAVGRGSEAIPLIDESVSKAADKAISPRMIPALTDLRLRHFQQVGDPAGCRATAEMWEKLDRRDAAGLYDAASYRAVAAAVQTKAGGADADRLAEEDADRAMAWLTKAAATGFTDRGHIEKDADLDALRGRADFRKLLASLPEVAPKPRPVAP